MTEGWSNSWGFEWPGKDPNDRTVFDRYCADDKIVQTAGMQLVSGRDIDLLKYPNDSNSVILNESAVKGIFFLYPVLYGYLLHVPGLRNGQLTDS